MVQEIGRLQGHRGAVKALQVEDHVCLTGGEDGTVRLWDLRRVGEVESDTEVVSLGDISEEAEDGESQLGADEPDYEHMTHSNGIRQSQPPSEESTSSACARVLEGHSKAVSALFFEENCLVTGAADKTLRQWDLATGQCVMTMDILWAIAHPPPSLSASSSFSAMPTSSSYIPGTATAALGSFAVPGPPRADGSWDMYQDFVGAVQFWGYGLVSGSGDGAVRMWDSKFRDAPVLFNFVAELGSTFSEDWSSTSDITWPYGSSYLSSVRPTTRHQWWARQEHPSTSSRLHSLHAFIVRFLTYYVDLGYTHGWHL